MRLIYITSSFPFGPGEAFVMPELVALENQGHEVRVVPLWPRGKVTHRDAVRFIPNTIAADLLSVGIARDCLIACAMRMRTVYRVGSNICRGGSALLIRDHAVLPKAFWLARQASSWNADHIHAFWATAPASLALATSQISEIPWSFTAHRFDIVASRGMLAHKVQQARFVRFISQSGFNMSGLDGTSLEKKTTVLHLGVELNNIAPVVNLPSKPVTVLCAASLLPVKGHLVLLKAMEMLRGRGVEARLYLAGDGELRKNLNEEVHQRALGDCVRFLGSLSHAALMDLYASGTISIAVLASVDLGNGLCEGIPVSLMEAMSFGIPVIATETGGIPELLTRGAGWMVPAQQPQALADALELLIRSPQLRQTLGLAGRERIRNEFSASQVAGRLEELFFPSMKAAAMESRQD